MRETEKHVFFWGKSDWASQFHPAQFTDKLGNKFTCAEQYMMYQKAITFNDVEIARRILVEHRPSYVKRLGRQVGGFDDKVWHGVRSTIVKDGNYLKFSQNKHLKDILLATGDKVLVEASPRDRIWGVGLGATNPKIDDEKNWRGLNLLGKAIMKVRDMLK